MSDALEVHWQQLLTTALLGTDRRDPPSPPTGPVADVVADVVRDEPSGRMLADVAACAAVRRAAFVAGRPADRLAGPAPDPRPPCPVAAVATWRRVAAEWPVLEDEWVLAGLQRGWRLPADVMVALLVAHRRDPVRRARVLRAAGPAGEWVLGHVPGLRAGAPAPRSGVADAEVLSLPELAVPADLASLLDADSHTFVRGLLPGFHDGRMGAAHRPVLVNLLARCRPDVLADAADALVTVDATSSSAGLAHVLVDLARTRARMLSELA